MILLFYYRPGIAEGGMLDLRSVHNNLVDACDALDALPQRGNIEYADILDCGTGQCVHYRRHEESNGWHMSTKTVIDVPPSHVTPY